jgi:NADH-quinone oxidoreductase subunit L
MLEHAWIIPLIPAASFVLILFLGKRLPKGGSELGVAAVGIALALSVVVNLQWFNRVDDQLHHGEGPPRSTPPSSWPPAPRGPRRSPRSRPRPAAGRRRGRGVRRAGHQVLDLVRERRHHRRGGHAPRRPAVMMLFVVTLVSLLVHVYSTDYVAGDRRYTHYFAFLSPVHRLDARPRHGREHPQLLVCWELVGVCSFVLIGHWWEEKPNSDAALKAFLTNRVGDVGLLVGVIVLFFAAGGTFDIVEINEDGRGRRHPPHSCCSSARVLLILAVMSKSGQFILHTWLPDAMAGPTPVSALIHAATMVVAGVFMVARLYPVFFEGLHIGTSSVNLLAVVGGITVLGGAGWPSSRPTSRRCWPTPRSASSATWSWPSAWAPGPPPSSTSSPTPSSRPACSSAPAR